MTRAPIVALAAILTASCGASLMTLPQGPGVAAADAREALAEATAGCRAVRTWSAEIAVSGSLNRARVRARLAVGLAPADAIRLEAVALGQPLFVLVARADVATLLLQRDNLVLERGPTGAILEAVTGVPVDAAGLRTALTGCARGGDVREARALGRDWRIVPDGPRGDEAVYLRRSSSTGPWRLVAAMRRDVHGAEWRAEYGKIVDGLPRDIRLRSGDLERFDLHLSLSQVALNETIADRAFEVRIPPLAGPITLEQLRKAGPLGQGTSGVPAPPRP